MITKRRFIVDLLDDDNNNETEQFIRKYGADEITGITNGDMIKVMFPNCKDWKAKIEDNDGEVYEVHFAQLPNNMAVNKYEESWWNAPYRKE